MELGQKCRQICIMHNIKKPFTKGLNRHGADERNVRVLKNLCFFTKIMMFLPVFIHFLLYSQKVFVIFRLFPLYKNGKMWNLLLPRIKENNGWTCYNSRVIKILIYEARIKEGMSLRKLSKLTGISKTRLNDIENEKRSPTLDELERIATILEVKMESLYENEIKSSFWLEYKRK